MALGKVTFLMEYKPVSLSTGVKAGVPCGFSESWNREISGDPTDTVFKSALSAWGDYICARRLIPLSQDWVITSVRLSRVEASGGDGSAGCSITAKQMGILACPQERRGKEGRTDDPYAALYVEVGTSSAPRREQFRGIPDSLWANGGFLFDTAVTTIKPFFDAIAPAGTSGPYRASKVYLKGTTGSCASRLTAEGYQGWCLQRYSARRIGRPFGQLVGRRSKRPVEATP